MHISARVTLLLQSESQGICHKAKVSAAVYITLRDIRETTRTKEKVNFKKILSKSILNKLFLPLKESVEFNMFF